MRAKAAGWGFKGADHRNGLAPLVNIKTAHRAVSDIPVNIQNGALGKEEIPHNYSAYIARSDFSSDALKFKSILAYG